MRAQAQARHTTHARAIQPRQSERARGDSREPGLWGIDPPTSTMNVVRDVHDVFFDWFLKDNAQHLCLHAAAVRVGAGSAMFDAQHAD